MKVLLLLLAMTGGAAAAQRDGDPRDYGRPLRTPENMADMAMFRATRCAMDKAPPSARKVLETDIASKAEKDRVDSLRGVARECFPLQWADLPANPVRNTMAEIAYRHDYRDLPSVPPGPPPASFAVVPAGTRGTPQQEASWQLAAIAKCAVFVDAADAHEWIRGPRSVAEEDRRFAALKPAIGKCVPPEQAAALTPRNFRGPVATALLARATAAGKK